MKLGLNIDRIVYFAPYFYEKNEFGQNVIYWPSFVGIMLDSLSIVSMRKYLNKSEHLFTIFLESFSFGCGVLWCQMLE